MKSAHHLSDALFEPIYKAITSHHNWIAYRSDSYYLQKGDLLAFRSIEEARDFKIGAAFAGNAYRLIYATSVIATYRQIERGGALRRQNNFQTFKSMFMNEKNFEYLRDSLKYTGFGDGLAEALKEQMKSGAPSFHLSFDAAINKKPFSAVLSFRKSDNSDMYFFNSYHAALQRSNGEVKDHVFYLNKGKGVTVKEAYNLLEGRAVYKELENKEGQKYHAWLQIDFGKRDKNNNHDMKQYHEQYGYDLKEALAKFPIRDMKEPDLRDILLSSLQKGNLQAAAFEKEGGFVRMFIEANPQYKSVNLYDSDLKRVPKEQLQHDTGTGKENEISQESKQENKNDKNLKNENAVDKPRPVKAKGAKRSVGH